MLKTFFAVCELGSTWTDAIGLFPTEEIAVNYARLVTYATKRPLAVDLVSVHIPLAEVGGRTLVAPPFTGKAVKHV